MPPKAARAGASLGRRASEWANHVGALLFAALLLTFTAQMGARWLLASPLPWSDELAVVLYIALIFWALATMVQHNEHVAFDVLYNACPATVQRLMRAFGHASVLIFSAWALPGSWDYVHFMRRESSPVLDWSFQWVYLPFVVFLVALALRSAWALFSEFGPQRGRA